MLFVEIIHGFIFCFKRTLSFQVSANGNAVPFHETCSLMKPVSGRKTGCTGRNEQLQQKMWVSRCLVGLLYVTDECGKESPAVISKSEMCSSWQCSVHSTDWLRGASIRTSTRETDVMRGKYIFHTNLSALTENTKLLKGNSQCG